MESRSHPKVTLGTPLLAVVVVADDLECRVEAMDLVRHDASNHRLDGKKDILPCKHNNRLRVLRGLLTESHRQQCPLHMGDTGPEGHRTGENGTRSHSPLNTEYCRTSKHPSSSSYAAATDAPAAVFFFLPLLLLPLLPMLLLLLLLALLLLPLPLLLRR